LIFNILFTFLLANSVCPPQLPTSHEYAALEKEIEKKMRSASHLVPIAKEADKVLSQLLTNKSPVLIDWIEKRNLLSAKEQEIANEWRYYYLDQFILSQFPTPQSSVNNSVEKLFSDINQVAFSDEIKKKFKDSFIQAQKDSVDFIKKSNIEEASKKEILSRINSIELYWFEKLKGGRYQNKPLEFLRWGLAYDPIYNQINIGIMSRKYLSADSLYSVWIHEIAHSFDPCRWGAFLKSNNPFEKLYLCLRDSKAAGALKRDDLQMSLMLEHKKLSPEMAESLKQNPYCNRSFYPPEGIQKEQLPEVFADWFSAEVIAAHTIEPQKIRQDLCSQHELMAGSSYLSNQARLERIFYVQPQIKKTLNLDSNYKYCPLEINNK
jgi:hypothetical protein